MTTQQECSQFPLVEMESTTCLPILFISSYDNTTGVFTVPPGGDGVYYFSTFLLAFYGKAASFRIRVNEDDMCAAWPYQNRHDTEYDSASCSAIVDVVAGEVFLIYL